MDQRHPIIWLLPILLLVASPAWGHAHLADSQPGDGAAVTTSPDPIRLQFTTPVHAAFSSFGLLFLGTDGDAEPATGELVPIGDPREGNGATRVDIPVPDRLAPGWYVVTWEVLADDGHTTRGVLRFRVVE